MSNILTNNINPRSGNLITIGGTNDKVSIAGTLTYEDVSNIDSVGIITARDGLDTPTNLVLRTGGTERVRIDSSGNFGIGTTSPGANLELGTVGGSDQTIRINSGGNGYLELFADGSLNKLISGNAATGSASLIFETSSGGTENEAMRINSSGAIVLPDSSPGIQFGTFSSPVTSTSLDDYEEGTWTPAATGGTLSGTSWGKYIKIGNRVDLFFKVNISTMDNSTTTFTISGAPYIPVSTPSGGFTGSCMTNDIDYQNSGNTAVVTYQSNASGGIRLYSMGSNNGWAGLGRISLNAGDSVYGTNSFITA